MSLQVGQQLGSYEITSLVGKGEMGEVYRARDTNLKRDVAIKILPEEFSLDTHRVARFQREAESLAALNHQNIAAIHDLQQSDSIRFLILEFVEGDTLADILKKRGAVPVEEALQIATQICDALEAAHEKGIIHRDLKPANVKITPDGQVKVLDFGLAKAFAGATADDLSNSPTISMTGTHVGMILGTAAYMSPEQAKGQHVDRRTDIFAFGAVLYEMLTGKQAFAGETVSDILSRVILAEPDWSRLPNATPTGVRHLLKQCLRKDRTLRLRDAGDARLEILESRAEVEPAAPRSKARERLAWLAFAAALLTAALLAVPALRYLNQTPAASLPETRMEIVTPATTDPVSFALSPDGRQIVFAASGDASTRRLWLRSLASTSAQPLAGTEGATYPFWSPDSRSVGFFADGKLKRLDIGGGPPQALASVSASRSGGTWNAAGVILFPANIAGPLFRVPASGGEVVPVTKLDGQSSHRFPYFLPDGRQFLFWALGTPETSGIYLASLDSAETRRLTPADTAAVYMFSGWLLWVRGGALVAQQLNPNQKVLTGDPVILADQVAFDGGAAAVSVSAAGVVAYRVAGAKRQLVWFDRSGKMLSAMSAPDENVLNAPAISPDGRRVAVNRLVQGNADIWLLDGTRTSRLTFDPARDTTPIWSHDGDRIVFASNRKGHGDLYQASSSGGGMEELLVESQQDKSPSDWSSDGRFILYHSIDPQTASDLWVLPMDGDRKPWVFLKTSFDERYAQFSPDGRWVTYMSNESGRSEIYIRPFAAPSASGSTTTRASGQWQVSTSGGINPRWGPDGKELYYIGPNSEVMGAPIRATGTTLEPGAPVALFPARIVGGGTAEARQYDVSRDGRFLINMVPDEASSPIIFLQNWKPPAK